MAVMNNVVYKGQCLTCDDEWLDREPPIICPECHSLNVRSVETPSPDRTVEGRRP